MACPIPRPEHPRPDFMRNTFCSLDGTWQFAFDDDETGISQGYSKPGCALPLEIAVPFPYQSKMSGLGPTDDIHPVIWYRRTFAVPHDIASCRRTLLHFGAVDYKCDVYINGTHIGEHKGGYTPFEFDITPYLAGKENDLCVRVEDYPDRTQPRGKQIWYAKPAGCSYTAASGIWQSVYLEGVGSIGIKYIHITPDCDNNLCKVEVSLDRAPQEGTMLKAVVSYPGEAPREMTVNVTDRFVHFTVTLENVHHWFPGRPQLYDMDVEVTCGGDVQDAVSTYFGMRKIEVRYNKVYLNDAPIYQRLVLDQGYWKDSNITPPSGDALRLDVQKTLDYGFNGARKHQKIEDPRYYYWADKLGLMVWSEVPSPWYYTDETVDNLAETMISSINRDFNHPCIVCWTPLNESWGVQRIVVDRRQKDTARMLYYITKAKDGTRLCSTNDGWENVRDTDIWSVHDYASKGSYFGAAYEDRVRLANEGHSYTQKLAYGVGEEPRSAGEEKPMLLTEVGGIAMKNISTPEQTGLPGTWGYGDKADDENAFFARLEDVMDAIYDIPYCQGYCYTQLTDVMQEVNGIMTADREDKVDVERARAIFAKMRRIR